MDKAFDQLSHSKLLYKPSYYGIEGDVFNWFTS